MAVKFIPVWQVLGAENWPDSQSKVMIPRDKPRLILVEGAKGRASPAGGHLDAAKLGKDEVLHALNGYLADLSLSQDDQKVLLGALQSRITQSLANGGQLLSVTGKLAGPTSITADKVTLKVIVADAATYEVAFKFLRHLDDDGNMTDATLRAPAEVDGWIKKLNWILGAQANVWFTSKQRKTFDVGRVLGSVSEKVMRNNSEFADAIETSADVTVYLVGKFVDAAGRTMQNFDGKKNIAVVVDDKCTGVPVVKGDEPFILTLAHELVHFVLDKRGNTEADQHFYQETNILLSKKVESTLVSASLLDKLFPPTK
jgi:hypothetical protein